ncbi:MAG: hypothetical protein ACO3J2_03445 [Chthoniobacterales bacterium]
MSPGHFPRNFHAVWVLVVGWSLICSAAGQGVTEASGTVRLEAENFSGSIARTINDPSNGSLQYAWQTSAAIGGFGGTGLVQVLPNNGTSVATNWTTSSPELR